MKIRYFFAAAPLAVAFSIVSLTFHASAARADEGMWTFDRFPSKMVAAKYGFAPSQQWLDHVRSSSLRIAEGCSASFISPEGLVMTNHHCVVGCVGELSTKTEDLVANGYVAKKAEDERKCPDFELDQLVQVTDVTSDVNKALAGKTGAAAVSALHAEEAKLQASCGSDPTIRCDVVSLYHGGVYNLYHYKKYTDVRLVLAPEYAVGQFGGDPDNFNFPRFGFDVGLLRAYVDGKPAATPNYLKWSKNGSKAGDLVFVSGNPGGTSRELTVAQLDYSRDHQYPVDLPAISEFRGLLEQFMTQGPEQAREANEIEFFVANDYKAEFGRQGALMDPQFFAMKVAEERKLRAAVAANPKAKAIAGSSWDDLAKLQGLRAQLAPKYSASENFLFTNGTLGDAFMLVRAATERTKPNGQRLPEYTDQALVGVQQQLFAPIPEYKDLDTLELTYALTGIRRDLGTDDPLVRKMLGSESPEQLGARLVSGTKLGDPAVRKALYDGGEAAIASSTDPMIVFARTMDPDFRAIRKDWEARIEAPTRVASEKIARARFVVYGTSVDPDATFTARLSFGKVAGFVDGQGHSVAPYTTMTGLFDRASGAAPYKLPQTWIDAKPALDLATPMNLSTTNDIIGGNSGSPLIDKNGEIVGLIFDGNIFSLGGDYGYDAKQNRSVAVDSRALLEGFGKVYHLDRIVTEINAANGG